MPPSDDVEHDHEKTESSGSRSKFIEYAVNVLAVLVLPLIGWVINLSVGNAVRDEHIVELQKEVGNLQSQQAQIEDVKKSVTDTNLQMVRLEGKLDLANGRLDEIKTLIH